MSTFIQGLREQIGGHSSYPPVSDSEEQPEVKPQLNRAIGACVLLCICACGGAQRGGDGQQGDSALDELTAIPAQLAASADKVLEPVNRTDAMLMQLETLPDKLQIAKDDYVEALTTLLAGEVPKTPTGLTGAAQQEWRDFVDNFIGAKRGIVEAPDAAKAFAGDLITATAKVPVLAAKAKAEIELEKAKLKVNPFASSAAKAEVQAQEQRLDGVVADVEAKIAELQDKVVGLPKRAKTSVQTLVTRLSALGVDDAMSALMSGTKEAVDNQLAAVAPRLRVGHSMTQSDAEWAKHKASKSDADEVLALAVAPPDQPPPSYERVSPGMDAVAMPPSRPTASATVAPLKAVANGKKSIIQFASTPPAAVLSVDGKLLCRSTPCSKTLGAGSHVVSMRKSGFAVREEVIVLGEGGEVKWQLSKNQAWLSVVTRKPGLLVLIDGRLAGRTPVLNRELVIGRHEVTLDDRCHTPSTVEVNLGPGQRKRLELQATRRTASVEVDVETAAGNAVAADVYVDGKKVGQSPDTFTVPFCSRVLRAQLDERQAVWPVRLHAERTSIVKLTLHTAVAVSAKSVAPASKTARPSTVARPRGGARSPVVATPPAGHPKMRKKLAATASAQRAWGWVTTMVGVLAAGGGGVAYALSAGEGKDLEDITAQQGTTQISHAEAMDDKARIEGDLMVRGAVLGAGLGLTALGVVLLATAPEAAAAAVTTDGRSIGLAWRF